MISVRTSAGVKQVAAVSVLTASGLKAIALASVRDGGGLQGFFNSGGGVFDISATPLSVFGASAVNGSVPITTSPVTVTVTGGTGPFTYVWAPVGAGTGWSNSGTGGVFRFTKTLDVGGNDSESFICTVTDARGRVFVSPTVLASVLNYGGQYYYA